MNENYTIPKLPARLIIPTSFSDCLTYGQRQWYMWKVIEQMQDKIDELEERIEALEGED